MQAITNTGTNNVNTFALDPILLNTTQDNYVSYLLYSLDIAIDRYAKQHSQSRYVGQQLSNEARRERRGRNLDDMFDDDDSAGSGGN